MRSIAFLALFGGACSMPNPEFVGTTAGADPSETPTETATGAEDESETGSQQPTGAPPDVGESSGGDGEQEPEDSEASESDEEAAEVCEGEVPELSLDCSACVADSCCAELGPCLVDADCECVYACLAGDGLGLGCVLACGLDPLDSLPEDLADALACTELECVDECPPLEL